MKRSRQWMDVLRRTAEKAPRLAKPPQAPLDDASLWGAHERAEAAVKQTQASAERLATGTARQRASLEAGAERARMLASRTGEITSGSARLSEVFDRLGLVALNAGLEGARAGEAAGRSLTLVADEVRVHLQRGAEAAKELRVLLGEIGGELGQVQGQLEQARAAASEVADESARAHASVQEAERALEDLGQRLRRATGTDPEVARAMSEAAGHARGLLGALSTISSHSQSGSAMSALRPLIEPLVRLARDIDADPGDGGGEEDG